MKKTFREDIDLIALSQKGDTEALLELWDKWTPFVHRTYNSSENLYNSVGWLREDFVQDAFVMFMDAVQKFSISKAEEAGADSFASYYYWYLRRLRNRAENRIKKYGVIKYASDYEADCYEKDQRGDSCLNEWNQLLQQDPSEDFIKAQAVEVVEVYFEEEQDPVKRTIMTYLLAGKRPSTMSHLMNNEYSTKWIRRRIKEIKKQIKAISERVIFEPISC